MLALRSGVPGLKTRSDHSLNLFLVSVPSSLRFNLSAALVNSQPTGLPRASWDSQQLLLWLCSVVLLIGPEKPPGGVVN